MRRDRTAAIALALSTVCAGCQWTGGGFRADSSEMSRLRQVLALEPGKVVADVGAGKGELTFALSREVGSQGRVFATEIDPERLQRLREALVAAKLDNVTAVEGTSSGTGLPPNCCDVIVLRRVYHHLTDPAGFTASLLRSLRPGGVLAVIDFPPPFFLGRGQFGVPAKSVEDEVTGSGFERLRLLDDWPGRGPLESYCIVFRRPS